VHRVAVERAVLERVARIPHLGQRPGGELVGVHDDRCAAGDVAKVGLERRRVHGDEHVRRVTWGEDVEVREVDLEAGDARERAGGRADLRGEVRQCGDVVAELGGFGGESVAGKLHPVAGVASEPDDHPIQLADLLGHVATSIRGVPA
jgi:hypothetical protein